MATRTGTGLTYPKAIWSLDPDATPEMPETGEEFKDED